MIQSKFVITRTEIKYLSCGTAMLVMLAVLSNYQVFDVYQHSVNSLIRQFIRWGVFGVFISALLANSTVIISVPHSLIIFTVVLLDHDLAHALLLGAASGLGAGLGRLISYSIAQRMASQMRMLPDSALYRGLQRTLVRYPNHIWLYLFLGTLSFLPDEIVITPVALSGFSIRRAALPIIAGKFLHTLSMIEIVMVLGSQFLKGKSHPEIILAMLFVTLLIMFYQIDKSKTNRQPPPFQQPMTTC